MRPPMRGVAVLIVDAGHVRQAVAVASITRTSY